MLRYVKKTKQKREEGYAIFVSVLVVGAVAVAVVFSVVTMSTGTLLDSLSYKQMMEAENYQDTCLERALEVIADDGTSFAEEVQLPHGTCSYLIAKQSDFLYNISVESWVGMAHREIQVVVDASEPVLAVEGWQQAPPSEDPEDPEDPEEPEEPSLCSNQQQYLVVNNNTGSFNADGSIIEGVRFNSSTNDCSIAIDTITISWNIPAGRRLQEITFDGNNVWSGNGGHGVVADVEQIGVVMSDGVVEIDYVFSDDITGRSFDFVYTLEDGTQKEINGVSFD